MVTRDPPISGITTYLYLMKITRQIHNDLVRQIRSVGEKKKDGTFVFHGKGADIILKGGKFEVLSCSGSFPMVAKIKTLQLINGYIGVPGEITEERTHSKEGFYEMMHMILRCNGQNGIEPHLEDARYMIDYLNDCAESGQEEF